MCWRGGCPCEPEESHWESYAAWETGRETGLRCEGPGGISEVFLLVPEVDRERVGFCEENTDQNTQECEATLALAPTANDLEDDGVGCEEHVEDAVDDSHVK